MFEEILKNRTLYNFYQLCQIPHGSGNEKAISDYLMNWAKDLGLEVYQDKIWNLIIKKPASPDRVDAAPVILQAHIDMVCAKNPGSDFDFETQPIPWQVDGDWITSAAHTTLGADCGIGVALIMTMLEKNDYSHPALEVVLTTNEETDMSGAYALDTSRLTGRRMINLDTSPEDRMLAGSAGGAAIELDMPVSRMARAEGAERYCITVGGMEGGHSGMEIDKGRNSALQMTGRLLKALTEELPGAAMVALDGGSSRLAIPRDAQVVVDLPAGSADGLNAFLEKFRQHVAMEVSYIPNFHIDSKPEEDVSLLPLDAESLDRFFTLIYLVPNGIHAMSGQLAGTVECSCNLGIVETHEDHIHCITELRGIFDSNRKFVIDKYHTLAKLLGGSVRIHSTYGSWLYQEKSTLRPVIQEVYRRREHKELRVEVVHAGNEIGIFYPNIPGLDAVAMGPTRFYNHTPRENLSISSSVRYEGFLQEILESLT